MWSTFTASQKDYLNDEPQLQETYSMDYRFKKPLARTSLSYSIPKLDKPKKLHSFFRSLLYKVIDLLYTIFTAVLNRPRKLIVSLNCVYG